jgi:hypothetical protein
VNDHEEMFDPHLNLASALRLFQQLGLVCGQPDNVVRLD